MRMRGGANRAASKTRRARALLLQRTAYGEADLVLQFLTPDFGRLSLVARAARKSQKRFGGALEPMHELSIEFDDRPGAELGVLREARVTKPRMGVLSRLSALEAAGVALTWARRALPARVPEEAIWAACGGLLDALELAASEHNHADISGAARLGRGAWDRSLLAKFGTQLVLALGWGLELDACVVCRRPCPAEQSAQVSPQRGGVVCQSCGGAERLLPGATRMRLLGVAAGGELEVSDAEQAIQLVEAVLRAHAGLE